MPRKSVVVGAVLVCLLGAGIIEFPRALEPSHSERNGIVLDLRGASVDGSGDWAIAEPGLAVVSTPAGIHLTANAHVTVLYSRPLQVFAHTCYELSASGRTQGTIVLTVFTFKLTHRLLAPSPLRRALTTKRAPFSTGADRTVVIALAGGRSGGSAVLSGIDLSRVATARCQT